MTCSQVSMQREPMSVWIRCSLPVARRRISRQCFYQLSKTFCPESPYRSCLFVRISFVSMYDESNIQMQMYIILYVEHNDLYIMVPGSRWKGLGWESCNISTIRVCCKSGESFSIYHKVVLGLIDYNRSILSQHCCARSHCANLCQYEAAKMRAPEF